MTQTTHIERSALLIKLRISRWTARKADKRAGNDVATDNAAKAGTVRVTKDLIARDKINAISAQYEAAFAFLKNITVPWGDDGSRLLPADMLTRFMIGIEDHRKAYFAAVDDLLDNFDELYMQAMKDMGDLFDPSVYPTRSEIRAKYTFVHETLPVPTSGDIRVDVPDSLRQSIANQIDNAVAQRSEAVTSAVHSRLVDVLKRTNDILSADKPRIYDTLTKSLRDIVDVLPSLNIHKDPKLTAAHMSLFNAMHGITTDALREDPAVRETLVSVSADLMADLL